MSTTITPRNVTAATWTAANPVLPLGTRGEEVDTGKSKTGDGVTAWASLAYDPVEARPSGHVVQTSAQSVTSSTSAVSSGLTFQALPGSAYEFDATIVYEGATNGDLRLKMNAPAGATVLWESVGPADTATALPPALVSSGLMSGTGAIQRHGGVGAGVPVVARMRGKVTTASAGGAVTVQFTQWTSDATATVLRAESSLNFRRLH